MAKYRRGKKIQPAVQIFTFATPSTSAGTWYIDLSQVASLVNRRFYRQGINWAVASIKLASTRGGQANVYKLPNTWVMSNAWTKAFKVWQKMNSEALDEADSVRPKFLDFKIYADAGHHAAGFGANLLPYSAAGSVATPGEWVASKIVQPDPNAAAGITYDRELIAVGGNYPGGGASGLNAVSLIEGYAASRGLPYTEDPNTPVDALDAAGTTPENWMSAMFNEGTDQDAEVLTDMITENNKSPYPFEGDGVHLDTMYPAGANQMSGLEWHDIARLHSTSGTSAVGTQMIKGGNFPCGLMAINWDPDEAANLVIQVNLIPGNHRGYLCESMMEM